MKAIGEMISRQPELTSTATELSSKLEEWKAKAEKDVERYNARIGNLDKDDGVNCPECLNRGNIAVNQDGYLCLRECTCMKQRKSLAAIKKSGLGNLTEKRLKDYKAIEPWQVNIRDLAVNYTQSVKRPTNWFVLLGYSGTGKTHVCAAVSNYLMSKYHLDVRYIVWTEAMRKIKQEITEKESSTSSPYLRKLCNYEVLYIDDLFKGKFTDTDVKYAFDIINARYNQRLITVISSERLLDNDTGSEINCGLEQIDTAIAGRIKEMSGRFFVQIAEGKDRNYRMKGDLL